MENKFSYCYGYLQGLERVCKQLIDLENNRFAWIFGTDGDNLIQVSDADLESHALNVVNRTNFEIDIGTHVISLDLGNYMAGFMGGHRWAEDRLYNVSPSYDYLDSCSCRADLGLTPQRIKDEITGRAMFICELFGIPSEDFTVCLSHGEKQSDYWTQGGF